MRILLDMDEVLCDFTGGALRVHGWTRERLDAVWPVGNWSIVEPMGLTKQEFWNPIVAEGAAFWDGLEATPWIENLCRIVENCSCDWWIVTSLPSSGNASAYVGKRLWLRRQFGIEFDRMIPLSHKYLLANPNTALIDDREETVRKFEQAGGRGILFPCKHNRLWAVGDNRLDYINGALSGLRNRILAQENEDAHHPS